jgi:peptide deformylase
MALLNILRYPDERLHLIAQPVKKVNAQINRYINNMIDTMYAVKGIGLAATQVNIQMRIFVMDVSKDQSQLMVFINPEITNNSGQIEYKEGCLSIPNVYDMVQRAEHIKVVAINEKSEKFSFETTGLPAICIQHEIDHLNGKLFVEHLSLLKQNRIRKKIEKFDKKVL